jgi:hypothetical protein
MNLRYLAGWGFLVLAFLAAAFESAARGRLDFEAGFVLSSQELLSSYRPELLRTAQEWVEGTLHWALWDPVLVTFLLLPAWAFLGIPGIYLVLRYRPQGGRGEDIDEDQFFLFDRLSKRASEEGYDEYEDDIYLHEHIKQNYDPAGLTAPESMEDYVDDWEAPGPRDSGDLPGKS